jgi:hypothetical protein
VIKSKRLRCGGLVALMGAYRSGHTVLVAKSKGKKQLTRHRRRLEDNIKNES